MAAVFFDDLRQRESARGTWICAALLGCALLLGGGGSPAPFPELVLQIIAACAFAAWILATPDWYGVPRTAWVIAALIVAVPLIQLVPLPPAFWQAMAGRETVREALALIGQEHTWFSWSLAPSRTLSALLALGPPLAVLVMTAALDRSGRIVLLAVICGAVLLTLVVGALQLSGGSDSALRFYGPSDRVLLGFQANRNSTADLLLIGLIAAPALVVELARRDRFPLSRGFVIGAAAGAMALCLLGIVLTASRMGIALVPVAFIAGLAILRTWLGLSVRRTALFALLILVAGAASAWLLWNSAALTRLTGRLDFAAELRPELWRDSLYAARQNLPWGVGMGNFVSAILSGERLEVVRQTVPNRAHNDYLELAVEAGVFGLAVLSVIATTLMLAARKALRKAASGSAAVPLFALSALIVIALHSLVDYPLRSLSLACLGAACAGMLLPPRSGSHRGVNS